MTALLVALAGALGSLGRYALGTALNRLGRLPYGTILVNVIGSFAIGLVMAIFLRRADGERARIVLTAGFLGGFTTYSSFAYETVTLWERSPAWAAANVVLTLSVGIAACAAGIWLGRAFGS